MSKRKKVFSCFLGILCLIVFGGFLSSEINKDYRKVDVTFEYKIDIEGKSGSTFELVSLVPENVPERQEVGEIHYSPEPYKVFKRNGNTYAQWKFSGKYMPQRIEMRCIINLKRYKLAEQKGGEKLPEKERRRYLHREQYIDINKRSIKKAALSVGKFKTDSELARALTIFVIKNMKPVKFTRKPVGGARALKNGEGDCTEYSDLLVSLARQRGLPAKHVSGYLIDKKSNIGHSWVEIFTRDRGWVRVDAIQIDLRSGRFSELYNKYIQFSDVRSDPVLNNGMIFMWKVENIKGAKVVAGVNIRDLD